MEFLLEWTESALLDLRHFKKYEQAVILDQVEIQLPHEAHVETRNRKPLEPNALGAWELRIGAYRVFYNMDLNVSRVTITAVGFKDHNALFIRGTEFTL